MDFSADCWLQVSDASGKTLFSGTQKKGGKLNPAGTAPYKRPSARRRQYRSSIRVNRLI